MPSTHSSAICYYAVYVGLASGYLPIHPSLPQTTWVRTIPPILCSLWAGLVIGSRVALGHHTWPQVGAGAAYGAIFSGCAFGMWTYGGLSAYGPVVEQILHSLPF